MPILLQMEGITLYLNLVEKYVALKHVSDIMRRLVIKLSSMC